MPITPTNLNKHTITPTGTSKIFVVWSDSSITWGDTLGLWGSGYKMLSTSNKHVITPVNKTKN